MNLQHFLLKLLFAATVFVCLALPAQAHAKSPLTGNPIIDGAATFYNTNPFGLPGARGETADTIDMTATTYQVHCLSEADASAAGGLQIGWTGLLGLLGCFGLTGRFRLS